MAGYNKNLVIMTRGIVNKTTVMIKYDNVELIAKHQKVFSKLFNTYNVSLNIVGPKQSFVSGLFDQKIIDNIIKQYK